MNIIIDTHIFLWLLSGPERIKEGNLQLLESFSNTVYLSSISVAELMIKSSIGKLCIDFDPKNMALESGCELLDFTVDDALILKNLPFHHRDPFDRMLISQAKANDFYLMSDDIKVKKYDCRVL